MLLFNLSPAARFFKGVLVKSTKNPGGFSLTFRGNPLFTNRIVPAILYLLCCGGSGFPPPQEMLKGFLRALGAPPQVREPVGPYLRVFVCPWSQQPFPNDDIDV